MDNNNKMSIKKRDRVATAYGILTSLVTALALVDFNAIDLTKPNDVIKILVLALPAIGGYLSTAKEVGK